MSTGTTTEPTKSTLSDAELARKERNRQKALQLRASKLISHPYAKAYIL